MNMRRNFFSETRRRRGGFTLIELLTVIAIIGIMVSVVIGVSSMVKRKSLVARTQASLEQIAIKLDEHLLAYGEYPINLEEIKDDLPNNVDLQDAWERDYTYKTNASRSYIMFSQGPLTDIAGDDIYPGK